MHLTRQPEVFMLVDADALGRWSIHGTRNHSASPTHSSGLPHGNHQAARSIPSRFSTLQHRHPDKCSLNEHI
jgi:hypothetical protein